MTNEVSSAMLWSRAFQTNGKASVIDLKQEMKLHIFKEGKQEFTVVKEEV